MQLNPHQKHKDHSDNSKVLFPAKKAPNGKMYPATHTDVILPSFVCQYLGWRRLQPKTALQNSPLNGLETHFDLIVQGHLQSAYIEIDFKENNTGNSRFNIYNVFDRIEIEDTNSQVAKTIYPDILFQKKMLFRDRDYHERVKQLEGLQSDFTPETITLTQNTNRIFYLEFDIFNGSQPILNNLNKPILIKFFFKNPSEFVYSGSTNITIQSMNIIAEQLLVPYHSSVFKHDMNYRWDNYVRYTDQRSLQASQEYDIKLSGLNGLSAFVFFMIRPTPITNPTNWDTYQSVENFELRDRDGQIIAINNNDIFNRKIVSKSFAGEILNYTGKNIYLIPFAINPEGVSHGQSTGSFGFTTHEILHIKTPSTLISGNFEIVVWSCNYETYTITAKGDFMSSK